MKYVVLDNIRSAHNVGAIFRTCDGAGVAKLCLVGCTPAPIDRFGRPVAEIVKTSLGAVASVPWELYADMETVLAELAEQQLPLIAVEQTPRAVPWYSAAVPERAAFVFGNEVEGVGDAALAVATTVVEIPMRGQKESLNVSVSVGIILFGYDSQHAAR